MGLRPLYHSITMYNNHFQLNNALLLAKRVQLGQINRLFVAPPMQCARRPLQSVFVTRFDGPSFISRTNYAMRSSPSSELFCYVFCRSIDFLSHRLCNALVALFEIVLLLISYVCLFFLAPRITSPRSTFIFCYLSAILFFYFIAPHSHCKTLFLLL